MITHSYPGKFIVIEGLDGSGKTAQVDLLVKYLQDSGKEVVVTKEPTVDSEFGRKIKQVLRKEIVVEPLELQKLYVQDRREHLKNKVVPALQAGKYVVSSRYAFSTFAYGAPANLDLDLLIQLNEEFLLPDRTIIVDVSPESCVKRIESRGEQKEYFEELEKLRIIGAVYKKMPGMFDQVKVVNGEQSMEKVFEEIKNIINETIS